MLHGVCLKVKSVGKPDAVAPHVRFDERGWETGLYATAPILDSTIASFSELRFPLMCWRHPRCQANDFYQKPQNIDAILLNQFG